jgi:hypothetical protein
MSVGDAAQAAAAVAAIAGFGGLLWQVRQARATAKEGYDETRRAGREQLAIQYTQRLNEHEFLDQMGDTIRLLRIENPAECARRWDEWDSKQLLEILAPLNVFEELACLYNYDLVDGQVVDRLFGGAAAQAWEASGWLISRLRAGSPALYVEFEQMLVSMGWLPPERPRARRTTISRPRARRPAAARPEGASTPSALRPVQTRPTWRRAARPRRAPG